MVYDSFSGFGSLNGLGFGFAADLVLQRHTGHGRFGVARI